MDWSLKILLFSFFALFLSVVPLLSVSENQVCAQKFQNLESARSCYSEFRHRELALDFVLSQLTIVAEQEHELELYLTKFDPLSLRAREKLLYLRLSAGKTKEVLKEIDLIQKLDGDYFPPLKAAEILLESRNFAESRKILDQLLRGEPGNLEARKMRAVVLYELKEFGKSYEDLQYFAKNGNIADQSYLIATAKTLFELKEKERAREILQTISTENLSGPQLFSLADLAERMKEFHLAKQLYHQMLRQKSELSQVLRFGRLLMSLNNLKEAQDLFDRENGKYFSDEDFILAQVELTRLQGKLAQAGNLLEQKILQFPHMQKLPGELAALRNSFVDPKLLQALRKRELEQNRLEKELLAKVVEDDSRKNELINPKDKPQIDLTEESQIELPKKLPVEVKKIELVEKKSEVIAPEENRKPTNIEMEKFRTYRVRRGESLMTFSNRIYGTHQKWKDVFEWNRGKLKSPNHIRPGMKLRVKKELEGTS